ncbi:MAG: hypothetical protein WBN65_03030, partial [Gammaproteobacteria bacterium]
MSAGAPTSGKRSPSSTDARRGLNALLMAVVLLLGFLVSYGVSQALRKQAVEAWESESDQAAQALTGTVLGWLEESYAPVAALSVLFESSDEVTALEFLSAADALESRSAASFLDSVAVIQAGPDGDGWQVVQSNDPFGPLPVGAPLAADSAVMDTVR